MPAATQPTMTPEELATWRRRVEAGRLWFCEGDGDTCPRPMWKRLSDGRELCQVHVWLEPRP